MPGRSHILLILSLAFMGVMGVSIILPVLPRMADHFHLVGARAGWLVAAFTLPSALATPPSGILADRFGRTASLLPGLALFAAGGVGCALADDLETLLLCRAVQGLGAAPLGILYGTLAGDCCTEEERPRMMGLVGATISIATALYPLIGGTLGEFSWRLPFWFSLLALPVAGLALCVPLHRPAARPDWKSYAAESRSVILRPQAVGIFCLTFLCFCMLYGPSITYFPLLADELYQASPSRIGLVFTLASLGTAGVACNLGRLNRRFSRHTLMLAATGCYVIGQSLILLFPRCFASIWPLAIPICAGGMAQGLTFPLLTASLASLAETRNRAVVMAMNGSVLRLSQSAAPLFFGIGWTLAGWSGPYLMGLGMAAGIGLLAVRVFPRDRAGRAETSRP